MKRVKMSQLVESLIRTAQTAAELHNARAVILLAERPWNFASMQKLLGETQLIVGSDNPDIQQLVQADEISLVPLEHEPQARGTQVSQLLLEAIADEHVQSGDVVISLYPAFEKDTIDTLSVVRLAEQLARLTSRDLQRLETQVPLETLRIVVDLACAVGREGREGKPVGTLFVVGNHRKVMQMSNEQIHDPFKGYPKSERLIRSPRVRESIKELAQIDGAFIISADGVVQAAGRHLRASGEDFDLMLSKGLGSRHWAAAEISKATDAIAIAVSESTGTVRLFQDGKVVLRIEPMDANMKFTEMDTEASDS